MRVGEAIREARKQCGLSQRELAERLGVSQSYISQVESATLPVDQDRLADFARALNLPFEALHEAAMRSPELILRQYDIADIEALKSRNEDGPLDPAVMDNPDAWASVPRVHIEAPTHLVLRYLIPDFVADRRDDVLPVPQARRPDYLRTLTAASPSVPGGQVASPDARKARDVWERQGSPPDMFWLPFSILGRDHFLLQCEVNRSGPVHRPTFELSWMRTPDADRPERAATFFPRIRFHTLVEPAGPESSSVSWTVHQLGYARNFLTRSVVETARTLFVSGSKRFFDMVKADAEAQWTELSRPYEAAQP